MIQKNFQGNQPRRRLYGQIESVAMLEMESTGAIAAKVRFNNILENLSSLRMEAQITPHKSSREDHLCHVFLPTVLLNEPLCFFILTNFGILALEVLTCEK